MFPFPRRQLCHLRWRLSVTTARSCGKFVFVPHDEFSSQTPAVLYPDPPPRLQQPTNHLDLPSIEALKNALEGYGGGVILASHDQALISDMLDDDNIDDEGGPGSGLPRGELWEVKGHRVHRREEGGIALYLEELTALAEKREARRRAAAGR